MTMEIEKEIDHLREKVIAETMRNGGSTGSNLSEPLYFPSGPAVIPDNLPPEEKTRRMKASFGIREIVRLARSHIKD